jgi:hypothetical protein
MAHIDSATELAGMETFLAKVSARFEALPVEASSGKINRVFTACVNLQRQVVNPALWVLVRNRHQSPRAVSMQRMTHTRLLDMRAETMMRCLVSG